MIFRVKVVSKEIIPTTRVLRLPMKYEEMLRAAKETFGPIYPVEPPSWYEELRWAADKYFWEAKRFGILGASGCAFAGGQWIHDTKNEVTYQFYQYALGTIAGSKIYVWVKEGPKEVAAEVTEWGRVGGPHGWDKYGFVIGGVLTMPKGSNLGAIMSLFSDPPSLPFRDVWEVPVFPSEVPRLPCPMSALFKYRLRFPVPLLTVGYDIAVTSPEPRDCYVALWTHERKPFTSTMIRLTGSTQYRVRVRFRGTIPAMGFVEISDANYTLGPYTVSNVRTFPPLV